ncbi:MAG: hypothetical protein OXH13_12075 [Chloroflexi bacterium]|nr:hypothetical protein [Chloroflexota bacterium]MCY3695673.1 hypothetical protein [Chloroflexota bacterium]
MMLLGRSSEEHSALNLNGTVRNDIDSGVEHGDVLLRYADAAVGHTPDLASSREALNSSMGPDAVVDCAATIANFQRMVRIADGCGIPLDSFSRQESAKWRDGLGIDGFRSRGNTFGEG